MKKFTVILIPNSTKKTIQFRLHIYYPIVLATISILLLITSITTGTMLFQTTEKLTIAQEKIGVLENENAEKSQEIAYLNYITVEVEERLKGLNELEDQILSMVGIDRISEDDEEHPLFIVSRSDHRSYFLDNTDANDVEVLNGIIERQKQTMEKLITNVEKQLQYMEALPDLVPAEGRLSSPFGYRISPFTRRRQFHNGIDIANSRNTDIVAAGGGVVTFSGYNGGYGRMIMISHGNGYITVYAHNNQNLVEVGEIVEKGQVIAKMGSTGRSTGPHVHFEIRLNGQPIDPASLLKKL